MSFDRLLKACGYIESTPGVEASAFDRDLALIIGAEPPASPAYFLADQVSANIAKMKIALADDGNAFMTIKHVGDGVFDFEVMDALAAAGISIEETPGRITLHLPHGGGEVDGLPLAQMMSKGQLTHEDLPPLLPDVASQPDYLRHDPTKRHRRVRSRR